MVLLANFLPETLRTSMDCKMKGILPAVHFKTGYICWEMVWKVSADGLVLVRSQNSAMSSVEGIYMQRMPSFALRQFLRLNQNEITSNRIFSCWLKVLWKCPRSKPVLMALKFYCRPKVTVLNVFVCAGFVVPKTKLETPKHIQSPFATNALHRKLPIPDHCTHETKVFSPVQAFFTTNGQRRSSEVCKPAQVNSELVAVSGNLTSELWSPTKRRRTFLTNNSASKAGLEKGTLCAAPSDFVERRPVFFLPPPTEHSGARVVCELKVDCSGTVFTRLLVALTRKYKIYSKWLSYKTHPNLSGLFWDTKRWVLSAGNSGRCTHLWFIMGSIWLCIWYDPGVGIIVWFCTTFRSIWVAAGIPAGWETNKCASSA